MTLAVTVVICTHNPRPDYLSQVIDALAAQTLSSDKWELLLIDNASAKPIEPSFSLSWHKHGRHLVEPKLGLTSARVRGISESRGELIVFVDDDNVLEPHYLENALKIFQRFAWLGAWGGSVVGAFESPVPKWAEDCVGALAIREIVRLSWGNNPGDWSITPVGAGLCIRADVGRMYQRKVEQNSDRLKLDRRGKSLSSGGDQDIVYTSLDLNLGWGVFPELKLAHLIPKERLSFDYLARLHFEGSQSLVLLDRSLGRPLPTITAKWRVELRFVRDSVRIGWRRAALHRKQTLGRNEAVRRLNTDRAK